MQTKTYTYREPYFKIEVIGEGVLCAFALLACVWLAVTNAFGMRGLYVVFGVAAFYQVWNTFVARCYAHSVTLDEGEISFELFGRVQRYELGSLEEFRVREYPSSGRMYLRVGDHNAYRGRFWLSTKVFEDGSELYERVRDLEYQIHPDSLKAHARRNNEEYIKTFGYGRHRAKSGERRRVLGAIVSGRGDTLTKKSKEQAHV